MKARTRKTPWLLITSLVGFLAAAGATFVLHQHPGRLLVSASGIVPDDTPLLPADTAAPAIADEQTAEIPADARGDHYVAAGTSSNNTQVNAADDSATPPSSSGGPDSTGTNRPVDTTVGSSVETQPQTNSSSSSDTITPPKAMGTGDYANGGYVPFDCGVPAGCGGAGSGVIQSSATSGGPPSVRNSQGSGPQTDNSDPPTDNSDPTDQGSNPGQKSDPTNPGSGPSVAAAPELDPATLAGALTLLLGSLAIVRSRQVRARIR